MTLTPLQIYQLALGAGFPQSTAVEMVAIALKESSGDPNAHNTKPPDDSYGLWQINMYGANLAPRMAAWGLSAPSDLFDPATNAAAAFSLWGGNDANLNANWAIEDGGSNEAAYLSFLPAANSAAAQYAQLQAPASPTGGGGSTPTGQTDFSHGHSEAAPAPDRPASGPASPGLDS